MRVPGGRRACGWLVASAILGVACGRVGFSPVGASDATGSAVADASGSPFELVAPSTALPGTVTQLGASEPVTWAIVDGAPAAAVDGPGLFTAPLAATTVILRATSVRDPALQILTTIAVTSTLRVADLEQTDVGPGLSSQNHVVWDAARATWWVFYTSTSDATALLARHTQDWLTWSAPTRIALGVAHGSDGRNLAVTDRVLPSGHVVYIGLSYVDGTTRGHLRIRAVLGDDALDDPSVTPVTAGGAVDPDGPAIAIAPSGIVSDGTGFEQTPQMPPLMPCGDGDVGVYTSAAPDSGAIGAAPSTFDETIVWCVDNRVSSRWMYAASDDVLFHLYEDGGAEPSPRNLLVSIRRMSTWYPLQPVYTVPPAVFSSSSNFALQDWAAVPLFTGAVTAPSPSSPLPAPDRLVVARSLPSTKLDLASIDLASGAIAPCQAPPGTAFPIGTGTVLVPYGVGVLLIHVAPGSVAFEYSFAAATALRSGSTGSVWSTWLPLSPAVPLTAPILGFSAGIPSSQLSPSPSAPGAAVPRPALLWAGFLGNTNSLLSGAQLP